MKVDAALALLANAHAQDRLAQAYVIEGPIRGEAQDVAIQFLARLFCEATAVPCGQCRGCRQVGQRTCPDILWVEPEKKSRLISVEQVRALRARMMQTAYGGGWKAGVIVGADRLGGQAANAFLKILEEPPPQSCFLLLTDAPQFLLATVQSRCQRLAVGGEQIRLPEAWVDRMLDILEAPAGEGLVTGVIKPAAQVQALLGEVMTAAREHEAELAEQQSTEDAAETLEARVHARYREMRSDLLRVMLTWQRDVLILLCGGDPGLVRFGARQGALQQRAQSLDYGRGLSNVRVIETMHERLERNLPEALVLSAGFSELQ